MDAFVPAIGDVLDTLTDKQREVLVLLADGQTSKQIAYHLSISESAAVQRIETLRRKFGGIPRAEVARIARECLSSEEDEALACKTLTGKKIHLPDGSLPDQKAFGNQTRPELEVSDSYLIERETPWAASRVTRLVPEVLDGEDAAPARLWYVVKAAVGLAVLMLVLLAVGMTIGDLA